MSNICTNAFVIIGVGDGGRGAPPIQIYSGKYEMIRALKLGEDLFLETLKTIGLNIWADSLCPPSPQLLF